MLNEVTGNQIAALVLPTVVVLITSRDECGNDCVATVAWVMPISHEPSYLALALRPFGRTARAIVSGGCFVVNVLGAKTGDIAAVCGKKQGIKDRFAEAAITVIEANRVNAARVKESVSWIECELEDKHVFGDHELYIGRTVLAQTRADVDENGIVIPEPTLAIDQRAQFGHFEQD